MATMSVRGVITSRTGRTLKAMTPPTSDQLVVGAEPDGRALPPDRRADRWGAWRCAPGAAGRAPATTGRSTGITRSATDLRARAA